MAGSNSCLGIYFDNNIVKYAKVEKSGENSISIKNYGIKFVKEQSVQDTVFSVISDTNSMDVPVVISAPGAKYSDFKVLKQISNADRNNIIKLEFEEWCDKNLKNVDDFSFVQRISDVVEEEHYSGVIAVAEKSEVNKFAEIGPKKISAMYPAELTVSTTNMIDEPNYILVNLDKSLVITSVVNGKMVETNISDIGMDQIINAFIDLLGNYPKSYEACKQINVFSDGEMTNNKVQFEQIVEPVLQEVLQKVQDVINRYRSNISKIYISGMGTLFTNIDTLFTEYFNMRTEIFKPKFISDAGDVRNMADMIEALPAICMARYYLQTTKEGIDFLKKQAKDKISLFERFKKSKKSANSRKAPSKKFILDFDKLEKYLLYPTVLLIVFVIGYNVFTNLYVNKIDKYIADYNAKIADYNSVIEVINSDRGEISTATSKYKSVNDEVDLLIAQINNNEIGKFTTYNVAAFVQKLAKIVPDGVTLTYIQSDDNKKVTIGAKANEYPEVGYLVANLRLHSDILKNITINKVENGTTIAIEIGGELP